MVSKGTEIDMKSKRIVYQMSQELDKCSVDDDFQKILLSTRLKPDDLEVGFSAFLDIHEEIRDSIRNFQTRGEKDGFLKFLRKNQMQHVSQMLNKSSGSRRPKEKVRILEDEEKKVVGARMKVMDIPQLDFGEQFHRTEEEDEEHIECVSGKPRHSSRELPVEPIPSFKSKEKTITPRVFDVYDVPEPTPPLRPILKIASRPRPVKKSDQGMQTDEIPVEVPAKKDMADQGTTCDLLTDPAPNVEPLPIGAVEEVEEHISPVLSPISTVTSELSEGEVHPNSVVRADVISVRTDGSILEDAYFGESESDILRATSSSPLRVAEMDLASTPTRSQIDSL